MTLPTSGPISTSQVNTELNLSSTAQISFSATAFRTLAGILSGQISMSSLRGKSNRKSITLTINSVINNYDAYSSAVATGNYVAGRSDITITVTSSGFVGGGYRAGPAMTISGFTTGDTVTLNNSGSIIGYGGDGGNGGFGNIADFGVGPTMILTPAGNGQSGGTGLSLGFATNINNAGTIAGGGGGGGGGSIRYTAPYKSSTYYADGGGGGGGGGGLGLNSSNFTLGGYKGLGKNGTTNDASYSPGFGYDGGSGQYYGSYLGGGGGGAAYSSGSSVGGTGGNGGDIGQAGGSGGPSSPNQTNNAGTGGAAGYYISGGSYATWVATGTRYGLAG